MAQKTAWTAAALTQTDINTYLMHEGGAWTTWTPAVVQSGSVAATVNYATYARAGRLIHFRTRLTMTGTGTASNTISVTVPVTAASSTGGFGSGYLYDASTTFYYPFLCVFASTTTVNLISSATTGGAVFLGSAAFTAALTTSDVIEFSGFYESSS